MFLEFFNPTPGMSDGIILFPSTTSTLYLICIYLLTFLINEVIRKKLQITQYRAISIFVWHNLFVIIYLFYSYILITDAKVYYTRSLENETTFDFGSVGIDYFISVFDNIGISYYGMFIIFGFFGTIGLLFFDASLKEVTKYTNSHIRKITSFLIFLPSINFWTSAIGKDSLAFLSTSLAIWSSLNFRRRKLFLYLSIVIMFFVRPHLAVVILISFLIYQLINFRKNNIFENILILLNCLLVIYLFPISLSYAGVMNITNYWDLSSYSTMYQNIIDFIKIRQNLNLTGGSSIIIEDMNTISQMLTYLYRPLPYEYHNLLSFFASIDNSLLILFMLYTIIFYFKNIFNNYKAKKTIKSHYIFLLILFFTNLFLLSKTTANLGIAVRQKWMIMPILIIILLSFYSKNKKNEKN